jgi:hypothetical protein
VNVATKAENAEVVARLSKHLPPPIAPATPENTEAKAKGKKGKAAGAETPTAPDAAADPAKERGAMFERRDVNKDGKLSKEEFMDKQKDPEHAAQNFTKFDKDRSGDLSKEEFVKMGK